MKIDLHVHSKFSMRPSQWILKKIGCPESFTEPAELYRIARKKGMTHFTITDHNCIRGALDIAHLPHTFISEEVTSYFPDDPCKVHVLALDISEAQHEDIQKARQNIFDLAGYLNEHHIFHILAHPLYAINDRLTLDHVEKLLVLFRHFELNGARNQRENLALRQVIGHLTPTVLESLAEKHRITPPSPVFSEKLLFGGSDDHSSLNIARTHTEFSDANDIKTAFETASSKTVAVISQNATPLTMAHNLYGIAYQFYLSKAGLTRYDGKDVLLRFLDNSLRVEGEEDSPLFEKITRLWKARRKAGVENPVSESLTDLLRRETLALFQDTPEFLVSEPSADAPNSSENREKKWFDFVNRISNRVMLHMGNHLLDHVSGANVFNLFHTIGSAGGFYSLLAPYFVAYSQFTRDRSFSRQVLGTFAPDGAGNNDDESTSLNLAHFTDTYHDDVNGVAITLRQHVDMARKNNKNLTLITCGPHASTDCGQVRNYIPTGSYALPEYPLQTLYFPPFLDMLNDCYEQGFNQIHTSTPGPMGLSALAIAKILNIPVSGTYHTQIPQFASILTGDSMIEGMAWKYILWYYDQMDVIYVPSKSTRDELAGRGISSKKIRIYPRGIDISGFHPRKRQPVDLSRATGDAPLQFLYVGRVSREKNLPVLEQAFRNLCRTETGLCLTVAGDGPYLSEMKTNMEGLPVRFTGAMTGEPLKQLYASCDVFVFPSATDTFGNVVLEAQASGLPVIVTDQGGPVENMIEDKTGLIVPAGDSVSLCNAMRTLSREPERVRAMGKAARETMEDRSFEAAFLKTWNLYSRSHEDENAPLARAV